MDKSDFSIPISVQLQGWYVGQTVLASFIEDVRRAVDRETVFLVDPSSSLSGIPHHHPKYLSGAPCSAVL